MVDTLSLLGVIGTWLAVLLAFVALVGIVTPWLILRAVHSERNRALLSIRDINQDFISRGIGYGPKHRLFRKIKVPNLVPEDDWLEDKVIAVHGSGSPWKLGKVDETTCRTGWARFCRLLDAYESLPQEEGELVIHVQRTFLPVNRYEVLVIGLLGRYGHRQDGGRVFSNNPLRPDLDELRVLVTPPNETSSEFYQGEGREDAPPMRRPSIEYADSERQVPLVTPWSSDGFICGMTGSFRLAKVAAAADGSMISSPIVFTLHNEEEMYSSPRALMNAEEENNKDAIELQALSVSEDSSLSRLYWLASGFVPLGADNGWVACLQSPQGIETQIDLYSESEASEDDENGEDDENEEDDENDDGEEKDTNDSNQQGTNSRTLQHKEDNKKGKKVDEKAETKATESSRNSSSAAKLKDSQKTQSAPKPIEEITQADEIESLPVTEAEKIAPFRKWITLELLATKDRPISIKEAATALGFKNTRIKSFHNTTMRTFADERKREHLTALNEGEISSGVGEWILWETESESLIYWKKKDIQQLVFEVLDMDWHAWNFLIWKKNNAFWSEMLKSSAFSFLSSHRSITTYPFGSTMRTLLKLTREEKLQDWHLTCRTAFKEFEHELVSRITGDGVHGDKALNKGPLSQKGLSALKQMNEQLAKRPLMSKTVRYIIAIISVTSQDFRAELFDHIDDRSHLWEYLLLKVDRKNSKATWTFQSSAKGIFALEAPYRYTMNVDGDEEEERDLRDRKEFIFYDFNGLDKGQEVVYVSPTEVLICLMWAASSCFLWISSLDSRPLLEFVHELDDVVHIG